MSTAAQESLALLDIESWGLIDYAAAMQRQTDLVDAARAGSGVDTIVVCSHPPIVTLGRGAREGDVFAWQGETLEVNRGGRATYHGPSQIVVYPIIDLQRGKRDVHRHMRSLERAVVETLRCFGIMASGREGAEATGVWLGARKIASIGVGVRGSIAFHGLALNVESDPLAFQGIRPCGFAAEIMISMEEALGYRPTRDDVQDLLIERLQIALR